MAWFAHFLERYPELTLFLTIGVGFAIGSLRIGGFSLGSVTGSLFAGLAIGQLAEVPISDTAKSILFLLFLFGIGYSVGPQFMQALKRDGLKPVAVAVVVAVVGLATAVAVAKTLKLDPGFSAGLLSGALTESPAIGTATEAIRALPVEEALRTRWASHVAVADAVCYLFGAFGAIWFCSTLAPKLLRADLAADARAIEAELGIVHAKAGVASAWRQFELRAYRIAPGGAAAGRTVAEAETLVPGHRLFIQRIRRDGEPLDPAPGFMLQEGDIVAVSGPRGPLVELLGRQGQEVEDRDLLDVPVTLAEVMLTSRDLAGKTLAELALLEWTRSVYLRGISRGGQALPIAPGLDLQRGDLLRIVGPVPVIEAVAKRIGPVVQPTEKTDFVALGLAIFLGGLVGVLATVTVMGMKISLGTSIGTLLAGLVVGHLRSRHPLFARIPDGAVALMTSLGLAAFVGMVGLHAGPVFVTALAEAGIGLLFGGMVVTLLPQVAGLFFGHYVLRMNANLLLGALAGAQTMTAAMAAVQDRAGSPVAVLGYTPAVPIGHILLTTWGSVIVGIMAP